MIDKVNQIGYTKDRKLSNNKKRNGVIEMLDTLNEKGVNILQDNVIAGIIVTCENGMFLASKGVKVICKSKSISVFFNTMYARRLIKK